MLGLPGAKVKTLAEFMRFRKESGGLSYWPFWHWQHHDIAGELLKHARRPT